MKHITNIIGFFLQNIHLLYNGNIEQKVTAMAKLAVIPMSVSFIELATGWYIENQIFMTFVLIMYGLDTIFGGIVHAVHYRNFSLSELYKKALPKIFYILAGYVALEMIHQIIADVEFLDIYFRVSIQLMVILYPGVGFFKNLSILTGGKFPSVKLIQRFENFTVDFDINKLKAKENEKTDNPNDP